MKTIDSDLGSSVPSETVQTALPVQYGTADSADFELGTWTFSMHGDYKVAAGEFAILPRIEYQGLEVEAFAGQSMQGHLCTLIDEERAATASLRASHAELLKVCRQAIGVINGREHTGFLTQAIERAEAL